jgi:hypothetical protein
MSLLESKKIAFQNLFCKSIFIISIDVRIKFTSYVLCDQQNQQYILYVTTELHSLTLKVNEAKYIYIIKHFDRIKRDILERFLAIQTVMVFWKQAFLQHVFGGYHLAAKVFHYFYFC